MTCLFLTKKFWKKSCNVTREYHFSIIQGTLKFGFCFVAFNKNSALLNFVMLHE